MGHFDFVFPYPNILTAEKCPEDWHMKDCLKQTRNKKRSQRNSLNYEIKLFYFVKEAKEWMPHKKSQNI